MEVRVQRSIVIPHDASDARPHEIPFNIFDRFALDASMAAVFAFHPPQPPNPAIIHGLVRALAHFPTLTATVDYGCGTNRPRVLVGGRGGGARVVEAAAPSKLADHLPLVPHPDLLLLHPPCSKDQVPPPTLLQIQLTRFQCGGLIVGLTFDHRVADGGSISTFFSAWGQAVRGDPIDSRPVYDQSWLKPRSPPRCEYQHWGREFLPITQHHKPSPQQSATNTINPGKITNILLHFSSDFIRDKLKPRVRERYSSFEILLGYVWRKVIIARRAGRGLRTSARVSVNGRPRMKPAAPKNYFGNLVLSACPETTVKELIEGGVAGAAKIVHDSILDVGEKYFRSFIDFGAIHGDKDLEPAYGESAGGESSDIEVTSWLGFKFDELDFGGGGEMCAFLPTWSPFDGWLVFFPSVYEDGGIDVVACLLEEHAAVLREMAHSVVGPFSCL